MLLLFWHFSALQEAQEIFGGDFDFAEFDTEAYDHAEEEEEDQDDESWDRPKKQTKRRVGRRSIFEIYEPSELESSHMTDQDNEIRSTDMPERFQVCSSVGLYIDIYISIFHLQYAVQCEVYQKLLHALYQCVSFHGWKWGYFITSCHLQLRTIPVKPAEDDELEEEAEWIYRNAFSTPTISMQVWMEYLCNMTFVSILSWH